MLKVGDVICARIEEISAGTPGTFDLIGVTCAMRKKGAGRTFATCARTGERANPLRNCGAIGEISDLTRAISATTAGTSEPIDAIDARTFVTVVTIGAAAKSVFRVQTRSG
jgi:hypothetical protein